MVLGSLYLSVVSPFRAVIFTKIPFFFSFLSGKHRVLNYIELYILLFYLLPCIVVPEIELMKWQEEKKISVGFNFTNNMQRVLITTLSKYDAVSISACE